MLIVAPPGYVLTSGNQFVRGGPLLTAPAPGMHMLSDGSLVHDGPTFQEPPPFPKFPGSGLPQEDKK
jgi:hypothetical protein